jgi:hypothetical protein
MSPRKDAPDVDRLARSMLMLHGAHDDDDDHAHPDDGENKESWAATWSKAPAFGAERAEALREATQRDRERYLTSGLATVDCRFCHVSVDVKKLGPAHTSVQWSSAATRRCAFFSEIRESGGDPARARSCPKLADSIKHAVAEGCLEEMSSAPPPGDG